MSSRRTVLVLDWTGHWLGDDLFAPRQVEGVDGEAIDVRVTDDRGDAHRADVVWFHAPHWKGFSDLPQRRPGQPWALMSMEAAQHHPFWASEPARHLFDISMSHRLDADIPTPYVSWHEYPELRGPAPPRPDPMGSGVLYLASHPLAERDDVVTELMETVAVDCPGRCLNNVDARDLIGPRRAGDGEEARALLGGYPVVLAFENAREVDYASEKLYRPLAAGSIPVTRGAPNVRELVPHDDAVVDVDDFASIADCARYLQGLIAEPERRDRHLAWRTRPLSDDFSALVDLGSEAPIGRLARRVVHGCDRSCRCGGRRRDPSTSG